MFARISWVAAAMGALVGCYDLPRPECGFACGPASECPSDYTCNAAVNRCELAGTTPSCEPAIDAGSDARPDSSDDFTPPTVIGMVPTPSSTGVPITTDVVASFSEPMDGFTITTTTFTLERAGGFQVGGNVFYEPNELRATFEPFGDLLPGTDYTVLVLDGVRDVSGNALAVSTGWTFRTADDSTPPMVTTQTPAAGSTDNSVQTFIFARFDEPMNPATVTSSSVTVTDGATPVPGTVSYNPATFEATFSRTVQLAADTTYTVSLTSAIEDVAGNNLAPTSWDFTTGPDTVPPQVIDRTPTAGATGIAVTTSATARFDEPVVGVSTASFTLTPLGGSPVPATVTFSAATRTATLTPTLQLAPNAMYTAALTTAITDAATNNLAAFGWSFTTGADTIGPRLAQTTPDDLATAVPTSSAIVVSFDEPIQNVTTATLTVNGGAITGTIALSAGDTIATFTPDAPLPGAATISVDLTTAITDTAANPLAAPIAFSFMTAP